MKIVIKFIILFYAISLFYGCEGREDIYKKPLSIKGPYALYDRILFINETFKDLITIKFSESEDIFFEISHSPFEGIFSKYQISKDRKILYALSRENKKFFVYATGKGDFSEIILQSGFNDFVISEDESLALFFFSSKMELSFSEIFTNTSQVSLLNLKKDLGENNPWIKGIRSTGEIPDNITISPKFFAGGKERRIALIELPSQIFILDLMEKDDKEISIPLTPPHSKYILHPVKRKFYVDGETLILYLLTTNSQDIFEIKFQHNPQGEGKEDTNFTPSINQFASGGNPVDVISFNGKDGNIKILSLNTYPKDAVYIDSKTGIKIPIPLDSPADNIIYFEVKDGEKEGKYALLYRFGFGDFYILNLDNVEEKKGKALLKKITKKSIASIMPFKEKTQFLLFFHNSFYNFIEGLSIYDFNKDNFTSYGSTGKINSFLILEEKDSIFLTGIYTYFPYLSILSMKNYLSIPLIIDKEATNLYYIAGAKKILLDHGEKYGDFTVFDERKFERKYGLRIKGFIFDSIMDM